MSRTLRLLPGRLAVCRLDPRTPLPPWYADAPPFCAAVRTPHELSLVVPEEAVPAGVTVQAGWRVLEVEGPFDLVGETGVIAGLTAPLAEAGVSVFALATYDTDYLLVQADVLDRATAALTSAGHALR